MIVGVVLLMSLSQNGYVRSRVNDSLSNSQCLWWKEKTTITFHQSALGLTEVSGDGEFDAIAKAAAAWQTKLTTCASVSLTEAARTSNRTAEYDENGSNENVVLFRSKRCPDVVPTGDACKSDDSCGNKYDCWSHSDVAIGITTTTYSPKTGQIFDSDIELNDGTKTDGTGFFFTVVDSPPCLTGVGNPNCIATDVQNTVTHEFGHMLGLAHINQAGSTMAADARPGEISKRVVDDGSARFVCDTYPQGKSSRACVIKVLVNESLGKQEGGCSCGSGEGLLLAALGLLRVQRRR